MVLAVRKSVALADACLPALRARGIDVPRYERSALRPTIVHIGVGGFHRAHLARYVDELAEAGSDWGICGLGLLPGDGRMAEALHPQDHLYTLIERGPGPPAVRIVGSLIDFEWCAGRPADAAAVLADPQVAIVSMTITEAGYAQDGSSPLGTFDVVADALDRRRTAGAAGVSIVSCDNLPGNGAAAYAATIDAAERRDPTLVSWIEDRCSFPSSMVDRITPVTADADRRWLHDELGIDDRWPVVAEPFRQWVVEDDFVTGRPRWEDVGVLFSDHVHEWELYKLRMLNAAHSSMAYLCALAGITYVDEAMAVPAVVRFLDELLTQEAIPSLHEIDGHPRVQYAATVLERFANIGVRDQIARLCIDGTAKFPTFLVPTIEYQLGAAGRIECSALALAGWARYLATVPLADQAADTSGDASRRAAARSLHDPLAFLELRTVFPEAVAADARFCDAFVAAWRRIEADGPLAALAAVPA